MVTLVAHYSHGSRYDGSRAITCEVLQEGKPAAHESANVQGAATMMSRNLAEGGDTPSVLRTKVTSPGGTTAAALRELEESGIRGAFFRAMEACKDRSEELGAPKPGANGANGDN